MIEIKWREDLLPLSNIDVRQLRDITVKGHRGGSYISALGTHPEEPAGIHRMVARMYNVPPEEVDRYKQVLADLIQVKYGVTDVEIR